MKVGGALPFIRNRLPSSPSGDERMVLRSCRCIKQSAAGAERTKRIEFSKCCSSVYRSRHSRFATPNVDLQGSAQRDGDSRPCMAAGDVAGYDDGFGTGTDEHFEMRREAAFSSNLARADDRRFKGLPSGFDLCEWFASRNRLRLPERPLAILAGRVGHL